MDHALLHRAALPVLQQPDWPDPARAQLMRHRLAAAAPLVDARSVRALRSALADVVAGAAIVVQAGDCAEDPADRSAETVTRKAGLLDLLAGVLKLRTGRPVVRVGRIGGQYAKPRSAPTELVDGVLLPVYRGHLVNDPGPLLADRVPDPARLLSCHGAAGEVLRHLGWRGLSRPHGADSPVWTSHEALLLDYEVPLVRRDELGGNLLTSTHWPWVGERTREVGGPHVALLADVENPVACKLGPRVSPETAVELAARLDPDREPGRLTFIARMGADAVGDRLEPLVEAVRDAGHPAVWLCDPMHGNTVQTPSGLKTRLVTDLAREVEGFAEAVAAAGGVVGGLHLEATPDDVTECADDASGIGAVGDRYTTLCDPRLNPRQAVALVSAWPNGRTR
jgi:3-deoxy-7-phosphoheptulonate synthase